MTVARAQSPKRGVPVPYIVLVLLASAMALVAAGLPRYRRDVSAARARLRAVASETVQLGGTSVEYTDAGDGPCLVVSHGIFHGCDGGQRSARDVVAGRRVVVPSRFGYLRSGMPHAPTGAAQADVFAALLDHLGVGSTAVMGISAGTGAAVQMALRHPNRVSHLIVSSGNWPGSPTSVAPPGWARIFYNDPAMWLMRSIAPPMTAGLMGVPKGFPKDDEQAAYVEEMLDSIFPLGPRVEGAILDAYSSNLEINGLPLEQLTVPTLIIHSKDDPLASFEAARAATDRIPGAHLIALESGGHIGLGQTEVVRDAIARFLGTSQTTAAGA